MSSLRNISEAMILSAKTMNESAQTLNYTAKLNMMKKVRKPSEQMINPYFHLRMCVLTLKP